MMFLLAATGLSLTAQGTAASKPCTAAVAIKASVVAINDAPEKWVGRCVALAGPAGSIEMYSGVEGMYLSRRFGPDGNFDERGLKHRIGLYSDDNGIRSSKLYKSGIPKISVIGTVDTCERMQTAAEARAQRHNPGVPTIIMMGGYCHYYRGAVVRATSYSFNPAWRYERLAGEPARTRFGSLSHLPIYWPSRGRLQELATLFRAAIARGDETELAGLHDLGSDASSPYRKKMLLFLKQEMRDRFAVPPGGASEEQAFLVSYLPPDSPAYERSREGDARTAFGLVCYCRTRDCTKLWPLAGIDVNNRADQPYVCTYASWRDGRATFMTPTGEGGLAEPPRSALVPAGVEGRP